MEAPMDTDAAAAAVESSHSDVAVEQEGIVSRFAQLMGTNVGSDGQAAPPSSEQQEELLACFANTVSSDAVVCSLPSINLTATGDGDNPLPEVGQHMDTESSIGGGLHPIMEASVLSTDDPPPPAHTANPGKAASGLGDTSSWTKSSIVYASAALLKSIADSFSTLVSSRVKSWTLLMFKNSLSTGDNSGRSRILQMLSSSMKVTPTKSSFKTLQLPASAAGHSKEADVILPLIFEVVLNVNMREKSEAVTLRAPGTVSGNFDSGSPKGLSKVDIRLDSGTLLKSMGDQARLAVFKTVAGVTTADMKPGAPPVVQAQAKAPITGLTGFSSSLRLSTATATNSPQLAKARSSALRLNSVLQGNAAGKNDNPAGIRKQRSVQWDHPMELPTIKGSTPPSSKKPRVAQTSTRLKSFKSFGRPHAEDTASGPRNATFGNFGRKPIWGRDGKLANHPMPMIGIQRSHEEMMGVKVTGTVNATFGGPPGSAPKLSGGTTNRNAGVTRLPSSLPRTATALESWLMNAAGSN